MWWRTELDLSSSKSFDDHHMVRHTWGSAKEGLIAGQGRFLVRSAMELCQELRAIFLELTWPDDPSRVSDG
jgi:hypothetical protein